MINLVANYSFTATRKITDGVDKKTGKDKVTVFPSFYSVFIKDKELKLKVNAYNQKQAKKSLYLMIREKLGHGDFYLKFERT